MKSIKLRSIIDNRYLVIICRLLVGGIFVTSGIIKLIEPIEEFIAIGRQWDIISDPWLTWFITLLV